jgi:hypothetical protein
MSVKIECPKKGCKADKHDFEYIDRIYKYHRFEIVNGAVELEGDSVDTQDDEGWSGELRCRVCSTVFAVPEGFWEGAEWV